MPRWSLPASDSIIDGLAARIADVEHQVTAMSKQPDTGRGYQEVAAVSVKVSSVIARVEKLELAPRRREAGMTCEDLAALRTSLIDELKGNADTLQLDLSKRIKIVAQELQAEVDARISSAGLVLELQNDVTDLKLKARKVDTVHLEARLTKLETEVQLELAAAERVIDMRTNTVTPSASASASGFTSGHASPDVWSGAPSLDPSPKRPGETGELIAALPPMGTRPMSARTVSESRQRPSSAVARHSSGALQRPYSASYRPPGDGSRPGLTSEANKLVGNLSALSQRPPIRPTVATASLKS